MAKKVPIQFSATMEVTQLLNSVKAVKEQMKDIKLPAAAAREMTNAISVAQHSLEHFQEVSNQPIKTKTELKEFKYSFRQARNDYKALFEYVQKIQGAKGKFKIGDVLSKKQLNSYKAIELSLRRIEESSKVNSKEIETANAKLEKRRGQLQQIEKLQKRLNELSEKETRLSSKAAVQKKNYETALKSKGKEKQLAESYNKQYENTKELLGKTIEEKNEIQEALNKFKKKDKESGEVLETNPQLVNRYTSWVANAESALAKAKSGIKGFKDEFKELKDNADVLELFSEFDINIEGIKDVEDLQDALNSIKVGSIEEAEERLESAQTGLSQLEGSFKEIGNSVENTEQKTYELIDATRDLGKIGQRALSFFTYSNLGNIFGVIVNNARQAVNELDKVMTATAVVTEFSVGDMWNKLPEYTEKANELGASTLGAYETTTLFYQQGMIKI